MSMLRPRRDPRTAAPGLGAGVGGPGLMWGWRGPWGQSEYLCERDTKRNKETTRGQNDSIFFGCHHPVGPRSPTGQARRIQPLQAPDPPAPPEIQASHHLPNCEPARSRPRVHACPLQAGILLLPNLSRPTGGPDPGRVCAPGVFSHGKILLQSSPGLGRKPKPLRGRAPPVFTLQGRRALRSTGTRKGKV